MFSARFGAAFVTLLAVFAGGCGQSTDKPQAQSEVDAQPTSYRTASPQRYLAAIFDRYRNAASYQDRGIVRLSYQEDGRRQSKVAPLSVWLNHYQLYVEAYDARLGSDRHSMMAWINDETTDDFDSQVLLLPPATGRPTATQLLADPILVQRIGAGLAGPPPQLDWLFSPEPMKHLFHADHKFQFGQSGSIDGRLCRSVRVDAGGEKYQFWIDSEAGIVRQVDLPPVSASPQPGEPQQSMSLTLELVDASFDQPKDKPDIQPLPVRPTFVRHFVPLPPDKPSAMLGSQPAAFRLNDSRGRFTFSNRGSDRELTIVVRFSGDQQSLAAVGMLQQWNKSMPEPLGRRVRMIVLVDAKLANRVPQAITLPLVVDQRETASESLGLGPGGLAIIDSQGRLAWTQANASPDSMVQLGAIVADVLNGIDVPKRIRKQWNQQISEYRRVVGQQTVSRN